MIANKEIDFIYPLTPMQQGIIFHSLYAPKSAFYFTQIQYLLHGHLDISAFEDAWQKVLDRHSILRTAFVSTKGGKMMQVVFRDVELPLALHDLRSLSAEERAERVQAFLLEDRERGFDFAAPPLLRLALLRVADSTHHFVFSIHHCLVDGWSTMVLIKEVITLFSAFSARQAIELPPPRPFSDYVDWLLRQDLNRAETFWRQALEGFTSPIPLPIDHFKKDPAQAHSHKEMSVRLSQPISQSLQQLARQNHLTMSTVAQGAWAVLLSRYSGCDDVVFGATISRRPPSLFGVETMVGLFINTLPVRVRLSALEGFLHLLTRLQDEQIEAQEYHYAPLVEIQGWSEIPRGTPLFESIVVFENYPKIISEEQQDSAAEPQKANGTPLRMQKIPDIETTNYPLGLTVGSDKDFRFKIEYDTELFAEETIERMLGHLRVLLESVAADPNQPLSSLSLLTEAERAHLLRPPASFTFSPASDLLIHQLFASQAQLTPHSVALIFQQQHLTYAALDASSNQLAHLLRAAGVAPEVKVAICLERSLHIFVAVLAVLKAGGAYLPLDPAYPPARLAAMLADAEAALLITQSELIARLPAELPEHLCMDEDWPQVGAMSKAPLEEWGGAERLAYVIYTSGSTGEAKGVEVSHLNLMSIIRGWEVAYRLKSETRCHLQMASFAFDVFTADLARALGFGKRLVLCPREVLLEPERLFALIRDEQIDCAEFVPIVLRELVRYVGEEGEKLRGMRMIIVGSDVWYDREFEEVRRVSGGGVKLVNSYGVTECTIDSSYSEYGGGGEEKATIGEEYEGSKYYVKGKEKSVRGIGMIGELYIGGAGVARGYMRRAEQTAERFVPDEFSKEEGRRLYRTGDMGRWRSDGKLEYLGRVDHQVKVRGYRIELGEIEAALLKLEAVREAVVIAREEEAGEKRLVAYLVAGSEAAVTAAELRKYLKERLPEYMVPSAYVKLGEMPMTANGKLDRKALPAPEYAAAGSLEEQGLTPVEEIVAGIWSSVLKVEVGSAANDFFELGGHSLLATQVISRVRAAFDVELGLRSIFETPTVAGLAQQVEAARRAGQRKEVPAIERADRSKELGLSYAQQRLWFIEQLEAGSGLYNMPTALLMRGDVNLSTLEQSLAEIVRRHEVLRTSFVTQAGEPRQQVEPASTVALEMIDLRALEEGSEKPPAERRRGKKRREGST